MHCCTGTCACAVLCKLCCAVLCCPAPQGSHGIWIRHTIIVVIMVTLGDQSSLCCCVGRYEAPGPEAGARWKVHMVEEDMVVSDDDPQAAHGPGVVGGLG